jgi:1-phosphatidylinositol-3-phosphate 5-kinase
VSLEVERGHKSKSLPRLPSADDAYEYGQDEAFEVVYGREPVVAGAQWDENEDTPKGGAVLPLPLTGAAESSEGSSSDSRSGSFNTHDDTVEELPTPNSNLSHSTSGSTPSPPPPPVPPGTPSAPALRLSALRQTFGRTEQSLYAQLAGTPTRNLNDARRAIFYAALGARRRLGAWQRKHVGCGAGAGGGNGGGAGVVREQAGELGVEEPEWWGRKCHALPGGNVIVREDDWGSVIAFTLR